MNFTLNKKWIRYRKHTSKKMNIDKVVPKEIQYRYLDRGEASLNKRFNI